MPRQRRYTKQVSVRMSTNLYRELENWAEKEGKPLSQVIREILIISLIKNHKKLKDAAGIELRRISKQLYADARMEAIPPLHRRKLRRKK